MTVGRLRVRALALLVAAVLAAQAAAGAAPAAAAGPSPSPAASTAAAGPSASPAQPAPAPSAQPSPAASPAAATAAPAAPTPSPTPAPTAPPDPATGLKKGATEVASARTGYSQTYDNHDGTRTVQLYTEPVFYQPAGSTAWQPVRVGFAPTTSGGFDYTSAQAPVSVSVGDTSATADFLSTTFGPLTVGFRLPSAAVKAAGPERPTASGQVADYASVAPGVDLRVIAGAKGPKSFFIWRAAPASNSISYLVDAPGLTLTPQSDGSISMVDAKGATVASIPRPYAVDSTPDALAGGGRYTGLVSLSLGADGKTVTVTVDPTWLKTAAYPVYVDPSMGWTPNAGTRSYGDAHTASNYPNDTFGNYARPDYPYFYEMWNGTDPSGTSGTSYDFLRWDLTAYRYVTVDSASLALLPYHQYSAAPTSEVTYVRQLAGAFLEDGVGAVTWSNQPGVVPGGPVAQAGCVEGTWCVWDVKDIVQDWLRGSGPDGNYGFRVDTYGQNSTKWKRFLSSEYGGVDRPKLTMTYHVPTATRTTPAFTGAVSWAYADSGGALQSRYQVQVAATSGGLGTAADLADSTDTAGADAAWRVAPLVAGTMTDGAQYWYQVRAYNGTSWSAWAQGQFTWDAYQRGDEPFYTQFPFDLGGGWSLEVGAHNGAATLSRSFFTIPSYGPPQSLQLAYSSAGPTTAGMFGAGWSSNLTQYLTFENGLVVWHQPDAGRIAFPSTGCSTSCAAYGGHYEKLAIGASLVVTQKDQTKLTFQTQAQGGRLLSIANRFGKTLTLAGWGTASVTATDASGRQTILTVDTVNSRVTRVVDSAGRTWDFAYSNPLTGCSGDLCSITEPDPDLRPANGPLTPAKSYFEYALHELLTITRDRRTAAGGSDHVVWTVGYSGGLVSTVQGPVNSHADTFLFAPATPTAAATATYTEEADETTTPVTTAVTTYTLDGLGRATSIADPAATTTVAYPAITAPSGAVWEEASRSIPADGGPAVTTWAYDARGNVTVEVEPVDSSTSKVTKHTYDPMTNDLLSTWEATGVADTATTPVQLVTTYANDAAGHRTSENEDCWNLDANGNPVASLPVFSTGCQGGTTTDASRDLITKYAYTANDQLEYEQDPLGVVTKHVYDAYGDETAAIADCTSSGTTLPSPFSSCTTTGTVDGGTHDAATNVVTQTAYDTAVTAGKIGLPTSTTDAVGNTTSYTYDELGEQLTEALPGDASIPAQATTTAYDQLGNTLTETVGWTPIGGGSAVARTTAHVYHLANRETAVTDPEATTTATTYDAAGNARLTTVSGTAGVGAVTTTRTFDLAGRTLYTKVGSAAATAYTYTTLGAVATKRLPNASVLTATWNLAPRMTQLQTTGAGGSGTTVSSQQSDVLGRVTDAYNELNVRTHTVYDQLGRKLSETVAYGTASAATTSWTYDRSGIQLTATDPMGIVTTTAYDRLSRATSVVANDVASPALPTDDVTTLTYYDAAGNTVAVRDPRGVTTRTVLNARGLTAQTIADCTDSGTTPTTAPDACTGSGTHSDAANIVTSTVYDGSGAAVKVTSAVGRPSEATTATAYEPNGQVRATKDAMGTVTRSVHNSAGQVTDTYADCTTTGTANPADWANCTGQGTADRADGTFNIHTSYTYDDRGNQAGVSAPNGRVTTTAYGADNQVATVVDNDVASPALPTEDVTTTYGYDAFGRRASVLAPVATSAAAANTRTVYNDDGTVAETIANCTGGTSPAACTGGTAAADANIASLFAYDVRGNLVQQTTPDPSAATGASPASVKTQYAYDLDNRLCRVVENATGTTNLATLAHPCTDATQTAGTATTNTSTRYTYDGMGNLTSMVDAAGHTTSYSYDAGGHMTVRTDALGQSLMWGYDDLGQQISQRNRTDPIPTQSVSWAYDAQGRQLARTADGATTNYTFDLAGNRLTASSGAETITSTYDRLDRSLTTASSLDAGAATSYTYSITSPSWTDPSGGYQATLDNSDRATALHDPLGGNFTWSYRADGQPSSEGQPNGNSVTFTYDGAGRAASKLTKTGGTTQASYAWSRNQAGQVLSEASTIASDPTNNARQYAYDPLGRLASFQDAVKTSYGWAAVPNRTSVAVDPSPAVPTTYDAANRPATQNGVAGSFAADADGRVMARPNPDGTPNQRFTWDHLGRLTSVLPPTGGTPVSSYSYDPLERLRVVDHGTGGRIRFRYLGMTATVVQELDDATGAVLRDIGNGWLGDHLEDWTGTGQNLRVYGMNGHDDVTWTAGSSGSVSGTVRYDPYGTAASVTGSVPDFRFQGSWADGVTGLSWIVTRWYAPAQGDFVSEDSLLGQLRAPGSRHLYAYGEGNPVDREDPNGMFWYLVKSGNSLGGIASGFLGSYYKWPTVFNANRNRISNPDKIQVGWCLWVRDVGPKPFKKNQCSNGLARTGIPDDWALLAAQTLGVDWYNLTQAEMISLTLDETHRPRWLSGVAAGKYLANSLPEDVLAAAMKIGAHTIREVGGMTIVINGFCPTHCGGGSGFTVEATTFGHTVFVRTYLDAYTVPLLSHEYIHVLQQEGSVLNYSRYVNEAVAAYERGELTSGPTNRLEAMGYLWQRWNDAFDKYDVGRTGGARPSWCEFKPLFAGPANDWGC